MATIAVSGTNFDSYVTKTNADNYMKARIGSPEWTAAATTVRNQGLVTGTRWINRVLQRLVEASLIPDPSVDPAPDLIQDATTEAAFALIVDSEIQDKSAATSDNVKLIEAGSVTIEKFKPSRGTILPTIAQQLVNAWIASVGGGLISAGTAFGTGSSSQFCDDDALGLTVGFP